MRGEGTSRVTRLASTLAAGAIAALACVLCLAWADSSSSVGDSVYASVYDSVYTSDATYSSTYDATDATDATSDATESSTYSSTDAETYTTEASTYDATYTSEASTYSSTYGSTDADAADRVAYAHLDGDTLLFSFDALAEETDDADDADGAVEIDVTASYSSTSPAPWADYAEEATSVVFEESFAEVDGIESTASWFRSFTALETADLTGLDTSCVTSMQGMFYGCTSLEEVVFGEAFDTSAVESMTSMFQSCSSLTALDVTGFDTSSVTEMHQMFYGCQKLADLDVSGFDTSSVTGMRHMFFNCQKLAELDVSGWDTSSVVSFTYMFYYCTRLTSLDLSGWDFSSATSVSYMFYCAKSLERLELPDVVDLTSATTMTRMFYYCSCLTDLDVSGFLTTGVTDMSYCFFRVSSADITGFEGWDLSSVTDASYMFYFCSALTSADLTGWQTPKLRNMASMFYSASSLTSFDGRGLDVSGVSSMTNMFYYCTSLVSFEASDWDVSSVTTLYAMFYRCSELTELDLSTWDTASLANMGSLFAYDTSLTALDVSSFDTSSVTTRTNMMNGCTSLTSVTFGEGWTWSSSSSGTSTGALPTPPTSTTSGKWIRADDEGAAYGALTAFKLASSWKSEMAGTWVWQRTGEVTFHANSEVAETSEGADAETVTVTSGEAIPANPFTYLSTGHYFSMWSTTAAGGGETLSDGAVLFFTDADFALELYAVWAESEYAVTDSVSLEATYAYDVCPTVTAEISLTGDAKGSTTSAVCDSTAFTVSTSVSSDGTGTLTVTAASGLAAATHEATVTTTTADGATHATAVTLVVSPADLSGATLTFTDDEIAYTGSEVTPAVAIAFKGAELSEGVDFSLAFADNTAVGTATVIATGTGNFTGTLEATFEISPADVTSIDFELAYESATYDATAHTPAVTATFAGTELTEGVDYELSYADNTDAGTATVTASGIGNFTGETTLAFTIEPAEISDADLALDDAGFTYDATAHTPSVTATFTSADGTATDLAEGVDFELSYADNVNAGTASATVTGIGNFTGETTLAFVIECAELSSATVALATDVLTYTGSPILPTVVATFAGAALEEGVDFTLSCADNTDAGTASATVSGIGNFIGEVTLSFTIERAETAVVAGDLVITYDTLAHTPDEADVAIVDVSNSTEEATVTVDGELSFALYRDAELTDPLDEGIADVATCYFTASWPGDANHLPATSEVATLEVAPADIADATLALEEAAFTYDATAHTPAVTATFAGTELTEGVDYELSHADNVNAGTATATVSGIGNFISTASLSFEIAPAAIATADVALEDGEWTWSGSAVCPAVTATFTSAGGAATELAEGSDFELSYADNVNAGTATVTVSGINNFTSDVTLTFEIARAKVDAPEVAEGLVYTATEQTAVASSALVTVTGGAATDAGAYEALATLADTGNLEWADDAGADGDGIVHLAFEIAPADISSADLALEEGDLTYTGSAIEPAVTATFVSADSTTLALEEGVDFEVAYEDNTDAGTATVIVCGLGNFDSTATLAFEIARAATATTLEDATIVFADDLELAVTVTDESNSTDSAAVTLDASEVTFSYYADDDLEVALGAEPTDAGEYHVTAAYPGDANHLPSLSDAAVLTIIPADIATAEIALSKSLYTYSGSACTPVVTATFAGVELSEGVDFEVAYADNTDAGDATALVSGINNFSGESPVSFIIAKSTVSMPSAATGLVYTGLELTGVAASTKTIASDSSVALYVVTGGTATDAGSYVATVTLSDPDNYTWADDADATDEGVATVAFEIAADANPTLAATDVQVTYDGDAHPVTTTARTSAGVAIADTDVEVSYYTSRTVDSDGTWVLAGLLEDSDGGAAEPTDAGTCYALAELPETTNHASATATATVEIERAASLTSVDKAYFAFGDTVAPEVVVTDATSGEEVEVADGEVEFTYYEDASAETCVVDSDGEPTAPVDVGVWYYRAVFGGSQNYEGSVSEIAELVIYIDELLAIAGDVSVTYGEDYEVEVTLTDTSGTLLLTPSVIDDDDFLYVYYDEAGREIDEAPTDVGTYTYIAAYVLDASGVNFVVSNTATIEISAAATTTTATAADVTYPASPSVTATVARDHDSCELAGAEVTWEFWCGETLSEALSGEAVSSSDLEDSPLDAGSWWAVATFAGDANHLESTSEAVSFEVARAQTVTTAVDLEVACGEEIECAATVATTSGEEVEVADGELSYAWYADAACSVALDEAPEEVGEWWYVATYAGSGNYAGSASAAATVAIAAADSGDADSGDAASGSGASAALGSSGSSGSLAVGSTFTSGALCYRVTSASSSSRAVAVTGLAKKSVSSATVPATVTSAGATWKVTAIAASAMKGASKLKSVTIGANVSQIGASAFKNARKLKSVTVKTTKLTSAGIGRAAFKGAGTSAPSKLKVKVPKSRKSAYSKLLCAKGLSTKAKIC